MTALKALVLARGRGRRMQEDHPAATLTDAQQAAARAGWKALMPVAGHPFLDFVLSSLADAGCTHAAIVIGPEQRDAFEAYRDSRPSRRVAIELLEQAEPRGTADAVWASRHWVADQPFITINGDNLYPVTMLKGLSAIPAAGLAVFDRDELVASSNIPADRVAAFAIVTLTDAGDLATIVEKPSAEDLQRAGARPLISMNAWRFDRGLLEACRDAPLSPRGEYEIPVAAALAVNRGVRIAAVRSHGTVLDLSRQVDVADVGRRLAGVEPRP